MKTLFRKIYHTCGWIAFGCAGLLWWAAERAESKQASRPKHAGAS